MDALTMFAFVSFSLIVVILIAALLQIKRESDPLGLSSLAALLIVAAVTWYYYPSISSEANSFVQDIVNGYIVLANHRPFYQAIGFSAFTFGLWFFFLACVRLALKQGIDRFLGTISGGVFTVGCGYVLSSYSSGTVTMVIALFMIVLGATIMINCVKWYRIGSRIEK
jgi:hypothetical protein